MAAWKARDERVERWGCIREAWRNALANSQREEMRKFLCDCAEGEVPVSICPRRSPRRPRPNARLWRGHYRLCLERKGVNSANGRDANWLAGIYLVVAAGDGICYNTPN